MKTHDGFDQCYNGQAAVKEYMIVVNAYSNTHGNDKQEFIPTIDAVPSELGDITTIVADTGYFSQQNTEHCNEKNIKPIICTACETHNTFLGKKRNNNKSDTSKSNAVIEMNKVLKTKEGEETYRKRKQTVEPVSGIIKEVMGFRRFSLRGELETDGEWSLVYLAYNLKRFFNMKIA